jgi:fibronectin type 3 domain-containing protein
LKNINARLKYFREPEIKKFKDKLFVTYEYGNIFDGRYSGYKTSNNYYYSVNRENKSNKLVEIYPNRSDEYQLYNEYLSNWNYEGGKLYSSSEGKIYQINGDGTISKVLYENDEYKNGNGYSYSFTDRYTSAVLRYGKNVAIIDNNLNTKMVDIEIKHSNILAYLYDEYLIFIQPDSGKYEFYKYYYDTNQTSVIFFKEGSSYTNDLVSANKNGFVAAGWNRGEPYLAVADFSQDIIAPEIKFENNETMIENGKDIVLKWSAKDNNDELEKLELYKIVDGNEELIKGFTNIQQTEFTYHINESSDSIQFKIEAYDLSGNSNYDVLALKIIKPIIFESFNVNKTQLSLGEKIIFSWSSNGNSQTKYTVYKKELGSDKWSKLFEVKGVNKKVYVVKDFVGDYQFKIVANGNELICPDVVTIKGDLLKFDNYNFSPKGEFIKNGDIVRLKWGDNSDETLYYEVWVKTTDSNDFKKVAVTNDKFFDYFLESNGTFKWKIAVNYKEKYIESDEILAKPMILLPPVINNIKFDMDSNEIFVDLNFTEVENAQEYAILRSNCDGKFETIDVVTENKYRDTTVQYGRCYSYKVTSVSDDGILSDPSNEKRIEIVLNDGYNVVLENENNSLLDTNYIVLKFHPDRDVNYEKYEIRIGKQPNNLYLYTVTDERNVTISDLDYATTYYVEIYPLDFNGNRLNTIPAKLTFTTGFDKRIITEEPIISIDEISSEYVILSWNSVKNGDYYEVYRSEDGENFEYLYRTFDTEFVDNINLESGKNYYYRVKAVNGNSFTISQRSEKVVIPSICPQVITHAYNPETGEEKDFATPCDIPEGWIVGDAPDFDKDGINDIKDNDDDNDGISDIDEKKYGLNPYDPSDANTDNDGDGVSNKDEIISGSNPNDSNSKPTVPILTLESQDEYFTTFKISYYKEINGVELRIEDEEGIPVLDRKIEKVLVIDGVTYLQLPTQMFDPGKTYFASVKELSSNSSWSAKVDFTGVDVPGDDNNNGIEDSREAIEIAFSNSTVVTYTIDKALTFHTLGKFVRFSTVPCSLFPHIPEADVDTSCEVYVMKVENGTGIGITFYDDVNVAIYDSLEGKFTPIGNEILFPINDFDGIDNNTVSVVTVMVTKYTGKAELSIVKGWNLLSVPVNEFQNVENLGNFTILWKYVKDDNKWAVWSPDENTMKVVEKYVSAGICKVAEKVKPREGFWILSNDNYTLEFEGERYSYDTLPLTKGWNLVGVGRSFYVEEMKPLSGLQFIWKYKDNKWYAWSPDERIMKIINSYAENGTIGVIDKIDSGEGFWVKIK